MSRIELAPEVGEDLDRILDKWVDHSKVTYTAKRSLSAGSHTIVLEYYERTGSAVIKLDWARTSS